MKAKTLGGIIALSLIFSTLAGCNSTGPETPTTDPKAVYTEIAKSVEAQSTSNAAQTPKPSSTAAPTRTLAASSTLAPTGTKVNLTPGTPAATSASKTNAATTLPGVATATLGAGGVPVVPDKMAYVSQSPADNSVFGPGESFTMVWTLKNTGTTTWTTKYWIRLYGGERLGTNDFNLKDTVKPNETVKVSVEMKAPTTKGKYNTWWVISNADLVNFGSFNLAFEVK
jgi:hypothetical protein